MKLYQKKKKKKEYRNILKFKFLTIYNIYIIYIYIKVEYIIINEKKII